MSGGVNVVEIDLARQGGSVFPEEMCAQARAQDLAYGVCVFRATRSKEREACLIGLRQRLPAISIPLRPTDAGVVLDLQPLIDQCHERGRYHRLHYQAALYPPLSPANIQWVDAVLREHQLR